MASVPLPWFYGLCHSAEPNSDGPVHFSGIDRIYWLRTEDEINSFYGFQDMTTGMSYGRSDNCLLIDGLSSPSEAYILSVPPTQIQQSTTGLFWWAIKVTAKYERPFWIGHRLIKRLWFLDWLEMFIGEYIISVQFIMTVIRDYEYKIDNKKNKF